MDYQKAAQALLDSHMAPRWFAASEQLDRLSHGESLVLSCLLRRSAPAYPKELSREMAVSTARIAALLNRLENKGLAIRTHDPSDSRQVLVSLTAAGRDLIRQRHRQAVDALAQLLEFLGPEDTGALLRIQQKLSEADGRR